MNAPFHQSDPRILGRRTLEQDHRVLAARLAPGLSVLDISCGTGAITAGIARAVGSQGFVLGLDRDVGLLDIARREHGHNQNLRFELGDATSLAIDDKFDVVTAALTLQWISDPGLAIARMAQATKPSRYIMVLDYNHAASQWGPDPPLPFRAFYQAFLDWRAAYNWDNRMADRLPNLFRSAGLKDIEINSQNEVAVRGDVRFPSQAALWTEVMQGLGPTIVTAGFLGSSQLDDATSAYAVWIRTTLTRQTLAMKTVTGTRAAHPSSPGSPG